MHFKFSTRESVPTVNGPLVMDNSASARLMVPSLPLPAGFPVKKYQGVYNHQYNVMR